MDLAISNKKALFGFPVEDLHPKIYQANIENSRGQHAKLKCTYV